MLWLLAAELRKLIRPLVWGTGLIVIGFCLLITWGGANNARGALASPRIPDVCARAVTAQCKQVIAHAHAAARTAAAATSLLAQPGEIGHVAAGMLASVPGLLLVALVVLLAFVLSWLQGRFDASDAIADADSVRVMGVPRRGRPPKEKGDE